MTIRQKIFKHKLIIIVLLFCILARFYIFPSLFDENLPFGTNQGNYLHYIDALRTKGVGDWDYSWSAGFPLLTFYPPLSMQMAASLQTIIGTISAFKLVFGLFFALTPLAFYYLLNEFKLKRKEKIVALLLFSFTFYFNAIIAVGMQFALVVSTVFGILFFKFFIRAIKNQRFGNIFLSSVLLGATVLSHSTVTLVFGLLSIFYLLSSLWVKWDMRKIRAAVIICASGFLISAAWAFPFLLESSQNSVFELSRSPLTVIPFVSIAILYGYYVNFASILIGGAASLLLLWCLKKEFEIPFKKDVDSTFLKTSVILTFVLYVIIYVGFPQYFPIKSDRFINIWIIPFSILFARGIDKKIIKYLVMFLVISQIVLFIGTTIQTGNDYSRYPEGMALLSGSEGRVTFQPQDSGIDLMTLYLAPKYSIEMTMGDTGPTVSPRRAALVGNNISIFDCSARRSLNEQILSLDIFSRRSLVYLSECKPMSVDYKRIFDYQHTAFVVADKRYPSVVETFGKDSDFRQVKELSNVVIFEYLKQKPYIEASQNIMVSYKKEPNRISIFLKSDTAKEDAIVRLSEGWYPLWKSDEVEISQDEYGYMTFIVPQLAGEKTIVLEYVKPFYYDLGKAVSIASLAVLVSLLAFNLYRSKRFI